MGGIAFLLFICDNYCYDMTYRIYTKILSLLISPDQ